MAYASARDRKVRVTLSNGHYEYLERDDAEELRDHITRAIHDIDDEVNV